jgi:heme A synthase
VTHDLRRERVVGYFAVGFAFLQIVFGAVVRITESGMGCGDDWPRCEGRFFPSLDRPDLIIEVMHRYLAVGVSLAILAVLGAAIVRKRAGGPNLLRPALLALALVFAAALLGAVTVKMTLAAPIVVVHKLIALALLVTLAWFTMRAGGFGAATMKHLSVTGRTSRGAIALAAITLIVVVLGAFTANVTGAAGSCIGFPHCRQIAFGGIPLTLHLAHRILAFALLGHVIGMAVGMRRRGEHTLIRRAGAVVLALVVAQLLIAAAMIEMQFPAVVRSLHQAVGAGIWLSVFVVAALTRFARREENAETAPARAELPLEQPA